MLCSSRNPESHPEAYAFVLAQLNPFLLCLSPLVIQPTSPETISASSEPRQCAAISDLITTWHRLDKIKITAEQQPSQKMVEAIAQLRSHPPNRAPFLGLLRSQEVFCHGDILSALKILAVNTPSVSKDHLNLALDVLEALTRTNSWAKVPQELIMMRDKIDEILTQAGL